MSQMILMRMARKRHNPQFKINLIKTFNRAYQGEPVAVRNALRPTLSNPSFRTTFINEVIEKIIERTQNDNIDKNGAKFPEYSESYKNSDTFKIYQKSAADVNLTLSGEMLSSLKGVERLQEVIIELIGQENKNKAQGHIDGLGKRKVKRDFLGLPDDVLQSIMKESINAFRDDSFASASELFRGQDAVQQFGQIGDQPEFDSRISVQSLMMELMRNLNGN